MSRNEKLKFIRLVEGSQLSTNAALKKIRHTDQHLLSLEA